MRARRKWRYDASSRTRRGVGKALIFLGLLIVVTAFLVDMRVRPVIQAVSSYQSKIVATRVLNEAVNEELLAGGYVYSDLVRLTTDKSGEVRAIESDMATINRLKTGATDRVNAALGALEMTDIPIALGTLSGMQMLYGRGPLVHVRVSPKGYIGAQLLSEFTEAGINQTLHRIILEMTVNVAAIIPGYTTSVEVTTNYTVAETVIVGVVPDGYTYVITGDKDLLGDINDYNAQGLP